MGSVAPGGKKPGIMMVKEVVIKSTSRILCEKCSFLVVKDVLVILTSMFLRYIELKQTVQSAVVCIC